MLLLRKKGQQLVRMRIVAELVATTRGSVGIPIEYAVASVPMGSDVLCGCMAFGPLDGALLLATLLGKFRDSAP